MTDPIADMLTRIRNAQAVQRPSVNVPHSKIKEAIAHTLVQEGYIADYAVTQERATKILTLKLKYSGSRPMISSIKRISKPGRRLYAKASALTPSLSGYGITIISTSKGVMTNKAASQQKIGGELICEVW